MDKGIIKMNYSNQMAFLFVDPLLIEAVSIWKDIPEWKAADTLYTLDKEQLDWLTCYHPEIRVIYCVLRGRRVAPMSLEEILA